MEYNSTSEYFDDVVKVWNSGHFKDLGVAYGKDYIKMYNEFMQNIGRGEPTQLEEKFHPDDCQLIAGNDVDDTDMIIMCSQTIDDKVYLETFAAATNINFSKCGPVETAFYREMMKIDTQNRIKEI